MPELLSYLQCHALPGTGSSHEHEDALPGYFAERAQRAAPGRAMDILAMACTDAPEPECMDLIEPDRKPG